MRNEKSDLQFVKWSRGTTSDSFDVTVLAAELQKLPGRGIQGLDIGGGIGQFAASLIDLCADKVKLITNIEPSTAAIANHVKDPRIQVVPGNWASFENERRFDFIIFRTVLHHVIGSDLQSTDELQLDALRKASSYLTENGFIFVIENLYEPYWGFDITGEMIYRITSIRRFGAVTRALGANTGGEGVRFRSRRSWMRLYHQAGLRLVDAFIHPSWGQKMPLWQKGILLCKQRQQAVHALQPESR